MGHTSKSLRNVTIKDAAKGEVEAVFSTFDVIDKDGDVTEPGAFTDGAQVVISAYLHTSWQGKLPVGAGAIRTTDSEAILDGQFFLDTQEGKETFLVVKKLADRGLGEWSYGFDIEDAAPGVVDGQDVRILKRVTVHEVSPVMVGAGVNTRTLSAKSAGPGRPGDPRLIRFADDDTPALPPAAYKGAIRPHETEVISRVWAPGGMTLTDTAPVTELRATHAWVDTAGDPESRNNYRFLHHESAGGPANLRACMTGIAVLNGALGDVPIPADDRQGVWNHLASHLRDAGREAPELRSGTANLKLSDELVAMMAVVSAGVESAERVDALRAQKGKDLSRVNTDLLEWIGDDLKRLRILLDTPQENLEREFVRFQSIRHAMRTGIAG